MSTYCSIDQARSAGATGSDAEVTTAITIASERVERFTKQLFEPTTLTLTLDVGADGYVVTGKRVRSITSVSWLGASSPLDVAAYRVQGNSIAMLGGLGWADVTVLGAEPWNGGWANLGGATPQVVVVGSFGYESPPYDVQLAVAEVAATLRADDRDADAPAQRTDEEGNVVPTADKQTQAQYDATMPVRARTTGSRKADALLAPFTASVLVS